MIVAEAEVIRRSHLRTEFAVHSIAAYQMLGVFFILLTFVAFAVMAAFGSRTSGNELWIAAVSIMCAVGALFYAVSWGLRRYGLFLYSSLLLLVTFVVVIAFQRRSFDEFGISTFVALAVVASWTYAASRGLRRYRPWGKHATTAPVIVLLAAMGNAFLVNGAWFFADVRTVGVSIFFALTVSAPTAYAAVVLTSRRASVVFSKPYRSVVEKTPHLNPRAGSRSASRSSSTSG